MCAGWITWPMIRQPAAQVDRARAIVHAPVRRTCALANRIVVGYAVLGRSPSGASPLFADATTSDLRRGDYRYTAAVAVTPLPRRDLARAARASSATNTPAARRAAARPLPD